MLFVCSAIKPPHSPGASLRRHPGARPRRRRRGCAAGVRPSADHLPAHHAGAGRCKKNIKNPFRTKVEKSGLSMPLAIFRRSLLRTIDIPCPFHLRRMNRWWAFFAPFFFPRLRRLRCHSNPNAYEPNSLVRVTVDAQFGCVFATTTEFDNAPPPYGL